MKTGQLLFELNKKNIKLFLEKGELKVDAPKGALTPELLTHLKAQKEQLILLLAGKNEVEPIEKAEEKASYPLSGSQNRFWILDQLEGESAAYNMPGAFWLTGEFHGEAFQKAFTWLTERHDSLRTVFVTEEGVPVQKILNNLDFPINIIDMREKAQPEKEAALLAEEDRNRPFDLEKGPLVRLTLVQTEDEKALFLLNMHHIISDEWSINIFTKEFIHAYTCFKKGMAVNIKPLEIQYKDYTLWQNKRLKEGEGERQKNYWLKKLAHAPVLNLPGDFTRPATQTYRGETLKFFWKKELLEKIQALCHRNSVSLFMFLQALIKTLLHRYTGEEDILIGSPVAGRVHPDLENQIGLYLNTLVFRDTVSSKNDFLSLLKEVKKTCTEAFDHQDYPFERVAEDLNIPRDPSRSPLFDVMLVLQNNESASVSFDGLKVEAFTSENRTSKFDMSLEFVEKETGLKGEIEFNTDIYRKERICRMAGHLELLAEAVVKAPETPLEELNYLSEEEQTLLLETFNDTAEPFPENSTLMELFEAMAEKTPEAPAVRFKERVLSYSEFNEMANKTAYYLREKFNVQPDDIIGVKLERSEYLMIALMGIIKAGGAYLPLDPHYPEERTEYIVKDSGVKVVLSDTTEGMYLNIHEILESDFSKENPEPLAGPENLAYVIYTSGSTGKPKGTLLEHRAIVNRLHWMQKAYPLTEKDIILQKTTSTFDVSVWEFFWWSLYGASVCFLMPEGEKDPGIITETIEKYGITTMHFVPSMYTVFLDYINTRGEIKRIASLKQIFCSGEELTLTHVQNSKKIIEENGTALINLYGPTEAAIDVTCFDCDPSQKQIYIGKPISNITLSVVDRNLRLLPVGVPGELCISGAGLARGYLNKEELTKEKFLWNPHMGKRVYRTGDLARWTEEGQIEFLGRIDNQVKIRGFRIETGEIENTLRSHELIDTAFVAAKTAASGEKDLVAWYTSHSKVSVENLRSYLNKTLPDYMIPSFFVPVETMPLTPNGKVNRKALPAPEGSSSVTSPYLEAQTEIEKALVSIYEQVLGAEKIGILDNFFERGGHSLKGTQIVTRIIQELKKEITLKDVFTRPTVRELALFLEGGAASETEPLPRTKTEELYPLSRAQERLWILQNLDKESIHYNMPGMFVSDKEWNSTLLEEAMNRVMDRHDSLRTVFITQDDEPRQKISDTVEFSVTTHDLRGVPKSEEKVRELAEKDITTPFDLEKGPLLRLTSILKEGETLLLFNMHHIISDGWSLMVLVKEFFTALKACDQGSASDFKPLNIQYKDYSAWQHSLLAQGSMEAHETYWKEKLAGDIPVLNLPSEKKRPALQSFTGDRVPLLIPQNETEKLNSLCRERGVSLFMALQALVKTLFYRYTGQEDILLGSPVAGRVHRDLENQIGLYVNTLVFRDTVKGEQSFSALLEEVKKTCLEAFEHQEYPFDKVVEDLQVKRDLSRSPLFDVMVVLQNTEKLIHEGFRQIETQSGVSKFDMTLEFTEGDEGLCGHIEYNTDIYSSPQIERMCEHFNTLISSVVNNPLAAISSLEIMPAAEKKLITGSFNSTKREFSEKRNPVELLEAKAASTPEETAFIYEGKVLTYGEVNEKANILARFLIEEKGLKTGDIVGVRLERSPAMVIALLGIFKAGGVYLPLEPSLPEERIAYIIKDASPSVIFDTVNQGISVNTEEILKNAPESNNPGMPLTPDSAAYVIYTSGSTGMPKGTLVEHKSFKNTLLFMEERYPLQTGDRYLLKTNFSFDVSVTELFGWLYGKGALVILPPGEEKDPEKIIETIKRERITHINFVPSLFDLFLDFTEEGDEALSSLKYVLVAGEAFTPALSEKISILPRETTVENLYGPTEAAIYASYYSLKERKPLKTVPIGKPLSNTRLSIVDRAGNLLPIGVPGELCITGTGVARGYLNRPELTEEKFGTDPVTGERYYRTGDLTAWREDGEIIYLGRMDNQVKIRGFRIELGEIENSLTSCDGVDSAVVLVKEAGGDKELTAFYTGVAESSELTSSLQKTLPGYMVPSSFIRVDEMPHLPSGKINRKALDQIETASGKSLEYRAPEGELEEKIASVVKEVLNIDKAGVHHNFFDLGANSLKIIKLAAKLKRELMCEISVVNLYTYTSIQALADYLRGEGTGSGDEAVKKGSSTDIAIIGMSLRAPGAENHREFWQNLTEGKDSITRYTLEELIAAGHEREKVENPSYVRAFGSVSGKVFFDAGFFGYSPADAQFLNPQTRVFHEETWKALEDAGCNPFDYKGAIGLFGGATNNAEWLMAGYCTNSSHDSMEKSHLGDPGFMCSRTSYKLGLTGPSSYTYTACSSSLVNIVNGCDSLVNDRCDIAVAGGVSLSSETASGYTYREGSITSPDGYCRPFSEEAQGTVPAEGAGLLVLKKLDAALRDKDHIYAVIKGYGINNDGNRKAGFSAPGVAGQTELIRSVQKQASVDPETITYMEAHGTGTKIGDPIEIEALKSAFNSDKNQYCALGSVKSNIGHLDSAAGVAGVIKTALCLKNRKLVPSLYGEKASELLELEKSPFYISQKLTDWHRGETPLRAGVSSFGFGGTNAHILLEEAPQQKPSQEGKTRELITLSGKTPGALFNNRENLLSFLEGKEMNLSDLASTLAQGREEFDYRLAVQGRNIEEIRSRLKEAEEETPYRAVKERKILFLFPGQGSQYSSMGCELYREEEVFRKEADECFDYLEQTGVQNIRESFFSPEGEEEAHLSSVKLFITEYALAKLLLVRGVTPHGVLGHSLGEYTAACIAGVFTKEQALQMIYHRGLFVNSLEEGAMVTVFTEKENFLPFMDEDLSLAVENGKSIHVISGSVEKVKVFAEKMKTSHYECREVRTNRAYHSSMLDPVLDDYRALLQSIEFKEAEIPCLSGVTGTWYREGEAENPEYWVKHFRETVRFDDCLSELLKEECVFVEVGPGRALTSLVNNHPLKNAKQRALQVLKRDAHEGETFTEALGEMWKEGVAVNWKEYFRGEERNRLSLPAYAFDKVRYDRLFNFTLKGMSALMTGGGISQWNSEPLESEEEVSHEIYHRVTEYVPPSNEIEEQLVVLWKELLGREEIGILDDFFELGGDSLKGITLNARIQESFHIRFSLEDLYNLHTIKELASFISGLTYMNEESEETEDLEVFEL